MSDDLLICLYRERNQIAIDCLFERYKYYLYGIINDMLCKENLYFDYEEVYQDLVIVFMNCVEKYDEESGCFYPFVKTAVERKLFDKIKKAKRNNKIASLDDLMFDSGNESCLDYVAEQDYFDNYLYDNLMNNLDEKDRLIVNLKVCGYPYHEIAKMMGVGRQSIYRRSNKIKNILKDIIEKID